MAPSSATGGRRFLRLAFVPTRASVDLLVVDCNPLEGLALLTKPDRHLRSVKRAGTVHHHAGVFPFALESAIVSF
jgi:hypothetical protein